jgi:alkanesulfonate monooxygenase SsuD/methylene tetrahydromethanopterin reductase-like flavin-dependent oxidoreductase (luciferase family)
VATGATKAEVDKELAEARQTLVFTLSTPAYWPCLEYHGWRGVGEALLACTREGRWKDMDALVTDEILRTFVPSGRYDEIADILRAEYDGIAERILFPVPKNPKNDDAARRAIERLRAG